MSTEKKINSIPSGWNTATLADTGEIVSGGTPDTKVSKYWNGDIAWCTPTDITALKGKKFINQTSKTITEEGLKNSAAVLLEPGSLVICTRATIGDCAINAIPICTNQGFKNIIPTDNISIDYLYYLINNIKPTLVKLSSGSTFLEISKKAFSGIDVILPPLSEQQKIAEILTTVDEKIEVIDEKISKTQELKKGLMQRLLTKGIGHSHYKQSVIGEIPEGWKVVELNEILNNFQNGFAFSSENYVSEGIPIISMASISLSGQFQLNLNDCKFWKTEELENLSDFILSKGDVIVAMTDVTPTKNLIGRMAYIDREGPFLLNQRVGLLKIDENKAFPKFIHYIGNSEFWIKHCRSVSSQGAQANIGTKDLKKALIPLPPMEEQEKISIILQEVDSKIKVLNCKKNNTLQLKNGLTQDLLTGKIRVNDLLQKEVIV